MNPTNQVTSCNLKTILCLVVAFCSIELANAQDFWAKVPVFTTEYYSDNDAFRKQIDQLRSDVKKKIDAINKEVETKAARMSNEEKMALATRYQNMKPDEIVKFQNEMMELTQLQAEFQHRSMEIEAEFGELEKSFRDEFAKTLAPIESEYHKLPDGEGTPDWAIRKGEELMAKYNKEYEALCARYITSSNAKFQQWLKEYKKYLDDIEIPYNQKMIRSQYAQMGMEPDASASSLMALDKYLQKVDQILSLRRPYRQG